MILCSGNYRTAEGKPTITTLNPSLQSGRLWQRERRGWRGKDERILLCGQSSDRREGKKKGGEKKGIKEKIEG